jgi:nitroreductase
MSQLLDVIKSRRSIRAFEQNVPSKEIIQECLEAATWAPSVTNQQPWEFIVLTGSALDKINAVILEHFAERMQESTAFDSVPELLAARQQEIFASLMAAGDAAGITANDMFQRSLRFCDAPVGVYFVTRKRPDNQYLLSTAAALENFLLAACARGLGTCWLNVTVVCAEEIKEHLGIAADRELVSGVALGYPSAGSPINMFSRARVPVDEVTTWLGF